MNILSLDIGHKRVGVARASSAKIAQPLTVWPLYPWSKFIEELQRVVVTHSIDKIIIGRTKLAEQAVAKITGRFKNQPGLTIEIVDEEYTTQAAIELTRYQKRHRQLKHADAVAAQLILERYLNEHD